MRNVVLLRLPCYIDMVTPPLGIGYLLKALRGVDDIKPVFIDAHRDHIAESDLLSMIESLQPAVLGIQVFSVDYPQMRSLVPQIRRICPDTVIVAGGHHPSALPEHTLLENPELDYVVRGEGEYALHALVENQQQGTLTGKLDEIPNLVYRKDGETIFNPIKVVDINEFGAPDWEGLEPHKYPPVQHGTFHKSKRVVPIVTSRGCPYPCTFCAGHLVTGKKIRRRDIDSVVDEIKFLQSTYGFEEIIIEDENFTFYKDHVIALSEAMEARQVKCHVSFPSGVRLDRLDDEVIHHLRRMGTYMVSVGIESGSAKTLRGMKKNWDLGMVKERIRALRKSGITVHGAFILGFSGETKQDIKQSISFSIESGVDTAYFGNYMPLPGSEDFDRLVDAGELKADQIDWGAYTSYYGRLPYHPKEVSQKELLSAVRWATIRFYCRPVTMLKLLRRMSHLVFLRSLLSRVLNLFKGHGRNDTRHRADVPVGVGPLPASTT
ncbi:MAG: radical SAM protein [Phycisphaerales bacterium]|nr:MAG: radical SAM protein [Phycisphaerales bacterium]